MPFCEDRKQFCPSDAAFCSGQLPGTPVRTAQPGSAGPHKVMLFSGVLGLGDLGSCHAPSPAPLGTHKAGVEPSSASLWFSNLEVGGGSFEELWASVWGQ